MTEEISTGIDTSKTLETLTDKVNQVAKAVNERKEFTEGKIRENPLAYVAGAFAGGMVIGYLMSRGRS